jgi:hypothetical protein
MKTRIYVFEENSITFTLDRDNKVMVNATEMAKVFGKDVFQFTRIDSTKEFIEACQKPQFCGLSGIKKNAEFRVFKYRKREGFVHIKISAPSNQTVQIPDTLRKKTCICRFILKYLHLQHFL